MQLRLAAARNMQHVNQARSVQLVVSAVTPQSPSCFALPSRLLPAFPPPIPYFPAARFFGATMVGTPYTSTLC